MPGTVRVSASGEFRHFCTEWRGLAHEALAVGCYALHFFARVKL